MAPVSTALLVLTMVLLLMPRDCPAQLVVRQKDISVDIGRSTFLGREDLVVSSVRRGESCRIEVVTNDPITQRVGRIHPPIFDCDFLPKTVQYVHNGSPLLQQDSVRLLVHKFTDTTTFTESVILRVNVNNASHSIISTQGLRPLVVPEYNGRSNTIDSTALRFKHSPNQNVSCTVGFSTFFSPWPVAGQIVMGEKRQVVDSVKKDCREFLFMNLHYEHLRSPTPEVDYLPLSVEVYDPAVSDEVVSERFYLPIHIKGAFQNSPPHASFLNMYMMDVDQFVLSTVVPGVISAEDYETPKRQLVFNITKPFGEGKGYFVHLDNHAKPIHSFLQDDLDNNRIAYRPPSVSYPDQRIYDAELVVFDSHFAQSMPISVRMAVRPADTTAPRVSLNTGVTLLEGQSREITTEQFQVVDKDNLNRVRMYVKGGLNHGTITVRGKHSVIFSMKDVEAGHVVYKHDDSDSTRDRIELRISDGSNTVLSSFPIIIIPRDDTPPYLVNNLGLQVNEGGMRKISEDMLLAHDSDSLDNNIVYTIVTSPTAGDIIRKLRPSDTGTKIFGFRQRDVVKGQIYYRHNGEEVFKDSFTFTVQDHQDPPNESESMEFSIIISPMNENPPQIDATAKRIMYVEETSIGYIKSTELRYTDVESPPKDLTYTITTPPYFVYNRGERDAGRLVATHNLTKVDKTVDAPQAIKFTQADIDQQKIAYIPPTNDIGPESRLVRLAYTVEDGSGNKLYGQTFDIEVNPVNNHVPEFVTNKLIVEERGILSITTSQLSAVDVDTPVTSLKFILDAPPKYGTLQNDGRMLKTGSSFLYEDLQKKRIRYLHDGSDVVLDTFTLALTDGMNQATKVLSIQVVPVADKTPTLSKNLRPQLIVSEGEEATITTRIVAATDGDSNNDKLVFLIVKQPRYGVLQLKGQPATKFTQGDVKAGHVSFLHTSGEIGTSILKDYATFIISNQNFVATSDMPMYDLNITITPVNNQKPEITLGNPVFVAEGESFRFSQEVLTVTDPDSKTKEILFMITKQPQWGYIENTKPSPGSDKKNIGVRINSFTYGDILDGSINYVQANHKGVEPVRDEFEFYASDGKLNSDLRTIRITIVPANDEPPDLMLNDFSITEGGSMVLGPSMLDAIDLDVPKDQLKVSISQPPAHGKIVLLVNTRRGLAESEVQVVTIEEIHNGLQLLYKHDGSEVFSDKFAVTVSDGKHEVKAVCNISVKLQNDERPEIFKNTGMELEYGDYAQITNNFLQAQDEDNDDHELAFVLVETPEKGFLQFCPEPQAPALELQCEDLEMGSNFTQADLDQNRIRYIHTTSLGDTEKDNFVFVLTDGTHKRHEETFEIKIRNTKKANIAVLNKGMVVREGERVAISTSNLSATDESTKAEDIVFAIIRPPRLGQIENIKKRFVPISSFTQSDITSQRVVYNHLTKNDITDDSFTFTVTNGLSVARDGEFKINIQPMDRVLPSLISNKLLEVLQGTEEPLTPAHLKATDPDTAAHNISFVIAKPPTYGRLFNRGVQITNAFTQNDVDLGFISYESDGSKAGLDNFLFTLTDGRHEGFLINGTLQTQPAMMSIFIQPLVEDAPRLVVNKSPDLLQHLGRQRYGYKLTTKMLRAVDTDSDSASLHYVMTTLPKYGHLENTQAKLYVRRRFTQKDVDDGSLVYILDHQAEHFADSFSFRIEDVRGNVLDGQHYVFSWSRTQFDRDEIVACENVGILYVTVTRSGNLAQPASVGITLREQSAKKGIDFTPGAMKQINFASGESKATWQFSILDDGLYEPNKKLRLTLVDPVNTILGKNKKLKVLIINAVNGECEQFLGMVSKHSMADDKSTAGQSSGQYNKVGNRQLTHGFDNTYLNTEAEQKILAKETSSPSYSLPKSSSSPLKKKRKKKEKEKDKGRKKRRRNGKKKKLPGGKNDTLMPGGKGPFDVTPPTYPDLLSTKQVIKKCTPATKDLLHYDDINYQLRKCDGKEWQAWSPNSGNDGVTTPICETGWFDYEGRCYKPMNERLAWDEAEDKCVKMFHGHLTTIKNVKHMKWLGEKLEEKPFWIGLNDKVHNGRWQYTNGDSVTMYNWQNGKPHMWRKGHKKNCVVVKKKYKWRNKKCDNYQARYVCEALPNKQPSEVIKQPLKSKRGSTKRQTRHQRITDRIQPSRNGFNFYGNS
ncbi:FRAS1-related extracellular matrix protein 1-like isoform X1 [Biomphalaria glabrata]|uniref:FRAS1-related extracellular matrix protein 1-like isoform X1 n=1 Tax=Biomphalaria glabrata TaxID=6526 RepID=A0A9U8E4W3_BIOGL|nr:FRAS1-related extracellular matrix protein 1-like isoform X1 [Biomphalaria glabrata]XP_013072957.2 FRAS1-related extracellular matrix protein 1-like isoform X1 [Biomphalaria glabrata]XP_013072964.2 FRAS1-related extracellular matrix protein 1-like isoform X1 [Biomphalaria glabrata]XP_055884935.1 FRAS1-related extracellular matrix protein 1-like isoform X1 [Biomphalaria glabrata]XP_055884936.1 FRAS1-related extracellular matrix protein 1-like isoform X1 [Biomphalaria glabrata]XP_055884937.1 